MESNATRFISAYNSTDKLLRARYNLKPAVSFSEVVRKSATYSSVVRRYEDDLMDYARLRNAIIHNSNDKMVIAEPHGSVVEQIEHILEILRKPPLAAGVAHKALTLPHGTPLMKALKTMVASGYSNVPIIKDGVIIGVTTNKLIVEFIARNSDGAELTDLLKNVSVAATLSGQREHYEIEKADATADEILNAFSKSPKLQIIILTDSGAENGNIKGVLTAGDIIKLNGLLF